MALGRFLLYECTKYNNKEKSSIAIDKNKNYMKIINKHKLNYANYQDEILQKI